MNRFPTRRACSDRASKGTYGTTLVGIIHSPNERDDEDGAATRTEQRNCSAVEKKRKRNTEEKASDSVANECDDDVNERKNR